MFNQAAWIWTKNQHKNQRVHFFFEKDVIAIPQNAVLHIGCETKYYLFVNGELTVFDGGLFRESSPGNGYYDTVDVTRFLKQGRNEIVIMVWYYGVNFSYHLWWLPNRRTMGSHLRFFKQYNPLLMMQQGAPREGGFYQAILNTYLISKLMWNVSLDVDVLTREFNRLYFGKKSAAAVN